MTNAAEAGRFRIGGAFDVNRLGYGAMRIVGKGIWGPTPHRDEALKTLRRLPDLVATVQNRYNFIDRNSEAALDYCAKNNIGFIPWAPLDAGASAKPGSALDAIAHKHKASPGQIALAWLLKRSPVMLPIPGTGKVAHLEENVGAAAIKLTDEEFAALDRAGRAKA